MNLNRLFPRLTISAKLAIAFILVALVPLVIVGTLGARFALTELRRSAEAALEHDMELAQTRTSRALQEIEQHVTFVADVAGAQILGPDPMLERAHTIIESYLISDPSPLFRFKAIDDAGIPILTVDLRKGGSRASFDEGAPQALYQWTAVALGEGGVAILPIEVRSGRDSTLVTPAVAVVVPVFQAGAYLGAVIGEAGAEELFEGLELSTPALSGGITALADEDGRFLFHSEYKRDWGSLLVGRSDLDIRGDLPEEAARRVTAGGDGFVRLADGRLLSYRAISVGADPSRSLVLYRTLPSAAIDARIDDFFVGFGGVGLLLGAVVLAVSAVAARQITRPVYALGRAARELTAGGVPEPLVVETSDELEDLVGDFNRMAEALMEHRADLESLVEKRTSQLVQAEAHLGRIVTDAADAILALGPLGEVTLWNQGAEALFGYCAEEVLGRPAADVLGTADGRDPTGALRADVVVDDTETVVNYRTERRTKDGSWIPVAVTKSKIRDEHGATVGHSLIIRDERARERLEEQMRRSERLSAISIMAGGIAHELNNPLSILGNRIELMQREAQVGGSSDSMLEDLEVLSKHVRRIGSVTADLIRFARDDADELVGVDVGSVVHRVTRLLRKVFLESGLDLVVETEPELPLVLGSESVVETLLVNLLLNAQQATPSGGHVKVSTRAGRLDRTVQIEVRDSGPGVPEDLRRRVFEPFFTTKADRGGTGLGLAVCRALVDRVGGRLDLVNRNGAGATFVVSLPRKVEVYG